MATKTGRAMVSFGPGIPWEMREYPIPEPEPGAAVLKITMASICGTDVHMYCGDFGAGGASRQRPSILGHEFVGRVHKLGAGVTADTLGQPLKEGDRVVWSPSVICGKCPACLRDVLPCPNRRVYGGANADEWPHFTGAFADYYYLRPGQWIYKVPDTVPDAAAVYVDCAAATVAHALSKVWYVTPESRIARVRELTGGRGAEVVLEVVASAPEAVPERLEMLDFGGTYLTVGLVGPWKASITTMDKYPWAKLISHVFPLEEAEEAIQAAAKGKVVRAAVVMSRD